MKSQLSPTVPLNEQQRIAALRRYEILDTAPEEAYDDATLLATQISGAEFALLTFVDSDREWFKSRVGIDQTELPRLSSFCGQAILRPNDVLVVEDATRDARFRNNALVQGETGIRFYAGAPLVTPDGAALGTICVMDRVACALDDSQVAALKAISRQVVTQLELRSLILDLRIKEAALRHSHRALEQDQNQLKAANARLHKHSFTDPLTGLCNRRALEHRLEEVIAEARISLEPVALLMFDVDHFKRINDEYGHAAGDEVLCRVAAALRRSARRNDFVARYGGEEFVVLSPGVTEAHAAGLAERLRTAVRDCRWHKGQSRLVPVWPRGPTYRAVTRSCSDARIRLSTKRNRAAAIELLDIRKSKGLVTGWPGHLRTSAFGFPCPIRAIHYRGNTRRLPYSTPALGPTVA